MFQPTFRQLEYLIALDEEGHFGRAARRVAVSQPALSKQLREVEEGLGVVLFERGRGGTRPTRAGRAVLTRARAVLREREQLSAAVRALHDPFAGELALGAIPTLAPFLLPEVADRARAHPQMQLRLVEEQTEVLRGLLQAGELDGALVALPWDSGDFEVWPLAEDELLLATPAGSSLEGEGPVRAAVLEAEPLLLLRRGHCLREHALSACSRNVSSRVEASSLCTLLAMVRAGAGSALVPALARREAEGLCLRPVDPPASRTVALWLPRHSLRREALAALVR